MTADPTARNPWTVTLCWTPDQNFGAVSVHPGRSPVTAIIGRVRAGEPLTDVADDYGVSVPEVQVLMRLADDLTPEETPHD